MNRILTGTVIAVLVMASSSHGQCIGDANEDGTVDANDLLAALSAWGPCTPPCNSDTDESGAVDVIDILAIIDSWGECETTPPEVIFELDFEQHEPGLYDEDMLDEDWNQPTWSQGIDDGRVSIVETDGGENLALAVLYPEGEYGTSATGAQWKLLFEDSHDCVHLSYRLQFMSPFDFVKGGKLPGLIGGEGNTGGGIPDGTDGWSARMMWRTDGDIVQYVYHPDQPETYGEDMPWESDGQQLQFIPGQWYEVIHEIQMNTPGLNDGSITCWLDGELVLERADMRFRDVDDFAIDGMYFSTFFGGGSSSWSTTKDESILFDDFVIESSCE
ncbi:MAG: hypothetical protein P8M22_10890 [Phycisphaerales bacterium]|nr:hypothetical protein [Phycisphaerales bacterium]